MAEEDAMHADDDIAKIDADAPLSGPEMKRGYHAPTLTRYGTVEQVTTQDGASPVAGIFPITLVPITTVPPVTIIA
jgi:hypothetical protein